MVRLNNRVVPQTPAVATFWFALFVAENCFVGVDLIYFAFFWCLPFPYRSQTSGHCLRISCCGPVLTSFQILARNLWLCIRSGCFLIKSYRLANFALISLETHLPDLIIIPNFHISLNFHTFLNFQKTSRISLICHIFPGS